MSDRDGFPGLRDTTVAVLQYAVVGQEVVV
jgi:hypothetical protein